MASHPCGPPTRPASCGTAKRTEVNAAQHEDRACYERPRDRLVLKPSREHDGYKRDQHQGARRCARRPAVNDEDKEPEDPDRSDYEIDLCGPCSGRRGDDDRLSVSKVKGRSTATPT